MTREEILSSLRGRSLYIPDLQELLSQWPQYVSPELDRLHDAVDGKLQEYALPNDARCWGLLTF